MRIRNRFKVFSLLALMAFAPSGVRAASLQAGQSDGTVRVDYTALEQVLANSSLKLHRIVVSGYASPDGLYANNAKLARMRANRLKNELSRRYHLPKDMIVTQSVAEDWEGLEAFVSASTTEQLSNREALLNIINSNMKPDAKERAIRRSYPADFEYLKENCLPELRRAAYTLEYSSIEGAADQTAEVAQNLTAEGIQEVMAEGSQELTAGGSQELSSEGIQVQNEEDEYAAGAYNKAGRAAVTFDASKFSTTPKQSQKFVRDSVIITETVVSESFNDDAHVNFVINEATLRSDFNANQSDMDKISSRLDEVFTDPSIRLQHITIKGFASPDGPYKRNAWLAQNRADILREFVSQRYNIPTSIIDTQSEPEDWDGMEQRIMNTSEAQMPHKNAILAVIRSNKNVDVKERIIRKYVKDFAYMKDYILPPLRRSEFYIDYIKDNTFVETDTIKQPEVPVVDTVAVVPPAEKKPFYMAVKTNLLYDAVVVPNIGVEFYLGKQWSVFGEWHYIWLYSDSRHRYWQGYGGYAGVRKYFGSKAEEHPLTGHHVGLYGTMMTYDIEFGGRGYQMPNWGFGGGVEYGYSMPIARRFNLDFSLGVGYQDGKYYEYLPKDGHYVWQSTHKRHWFGPTKAEISLKWLLGRGNYHKKYVKNQ